MGHGTHRTRQADTLRPGRRESDKLHHQDINRLPKIRDCWPSRLVVSAIVSRARHRPPPSFALLCEEHTGKYYLTYHSLRKYSCLLHSPHGHSWHYYGANSQNKASRPDTRRTRPSHRGPDWRGLLLENSKGCFFNTSIFIAGFTPHEVRLDFDWKSDGYYCEPNKGHHMNLEHSGSDLRKFWDLETIWNTPSHENTLTTGDSQILQEFRDSHCIEAGCIVVRLPKKNSVELPSNRDTAERRFRALQKRLQEENALRIIYEEQMLDHVLKQQVELVSTTEESTAVFYLPHHAVKKERRGKIKCRIVFDASSSDGNNPSLNDAREMGPNLLPNVLGPYFVFASTPWR